MTRSCVIWVVVIVAGCGVQSAREAARRVGSDADGATSETPAIASDAEESNGVAIENAIDRKIIYEAEVRLVIDDFSGMEAAVSRLTNEHGGYLAKVSIDCTSGEQRSGRWEARIPVDQFEPLIVVSSNGVRNNLAGRAFVVHGTPGVIFNSRGDYDGDGTLTTADIDALALAAAAGTHDPLFDLTFDGRVDRDDVLFWIENLFGTQPGDANLDFAVDVSDFTTWNAHKFTDNVWWSRGNFNGDAVTDVSDFIVWNVYKFLDPGALRDSHNGEQHGSDLQAKGAASAAARLLTGVDTPPLPLFVNTIFNLPEDMLYEPAAGSRARSTPQQDLSALDQAAVSVTELIFAFEDERW